MALTFGSKSLNNKTVYEKIRTNIGQRIVFEDYWVTILCSHLKRGSGLGVGVLTQSGRWVGIFLSKVAEIPITLRMEVLSMLYGQDGYILGIGNKRVKVGNAEAFTLFSRKNFDSLYLYNGCKLFLIFIK